MFNLIPCYDSNDRILERFTQWDLNQTISVKHLNFKNAPIFHFCNQKSRESIAVQSEATDKGITAKVPNVLLQQALKITVFIYYEEELSGRTVFRIEIPVDPKPKPADYLYEDNITDVIRKGSILLKLLKAENELAAENIEILRHEHFRYDELDKKIEDLRGYLAAYTDCDIFGLQVDYENKQFTRLAGAFGREAGEGFNDFAPYSGMKRCNVSNEGTITAYFGDKNFKDDGTNGQVMVCVPKFYYKVVPVKLECIKGTGIGRHIRKANYYISAAPKDGFKLHPAFYNEKGKEVDFFLYSAYESSLLTADGVYFHDGTMTDTSLDLSKDLLCSVADKKPISGKYKALTMENAEKLASNRGNGWHVETVKALSAIQLLMMIEYGSMNMQNDIGQGVVNITESGSYNCASITGSTASLGNETGSASATNNEQGGKITAYSDNGTVSVSYRGIENLWGNTWKKINGVNVWGDGNMASGQPYIADDFNFDSSKNDGNYKPVGFVLPNTNGQINAMGYGDEAYDWLLAPSEIGGTSELPVGDNYYGASDAIGYKELIFGGAWSSKLGAGPFYWNTGSNVNGKANNQICRLICIPSNS